MMNNKASTGKWPPQENKPFRQKFLRPGIAPKIHEILARIRFSVPTPIQFNANTLALEGKDVIGIAQTVREKRTLSLSP
jgi:superfamily II DNA/RNA helicase